MYWVRWGVSGAIFILAFLRFWRVDKDNTPSKKNPIFRPKKAELSLETIGNSKMTYLLPSQGLRSLLHHCGCVTIKLRGVVVVAPVHMDRELGHYDPRDRWCRHSFSLSCFDPPFLQPSSRVCVGDMAALVLGVNGVSELGTAKQPALSRHSFQSHPHNTRSLFPPLG